mmetsp:Transcript_55340/g.89859  ORF Transcript_55340/g.89859 Transcript_55340/m.89859 type:complete len:107 (+) Transcript_55340:283-603(+)
MARGKAPKQTPTHGSTTQSEVREAASTTGPLHCCSMHDFILYINSSTISAKVGDWNRISSDCEFYMHGMPHHMQTVFLVHCKSGVDSEKALGMHWKGRRPKADYKG